MRIRNWLTLGCVCIISSVIISGCGSHTTKDASTPITSSNSTSTTAAERTDRIELANTTTPAQLVPTSTPFPEKSAEQATIAGNAAQQTISPDNQVNSLPAFNSKQPKVMGLAIQETKEQVIAKYGTPEGSFIMDDPTEPISVYQYEGFSVGFSPDKQVQFVDVNSASINPGLNGLRLGQTTDDAIQALGKPDSNSVYVLSYKTKKEILKLDIDPKTKTIQSIKLFGAN
jgi:hypothetical protein